MKALRFFLPLLLVTVLIVEMNSFLHQRREIRRLKTATVAASPVTIDRAVAGLGPEIIAGPLRESPAAQLAPSVPSALAAAREWLGDVEQAKEHFLRFPDKWIPELSLLGEKDLLLALRNADMSTEAGQRAALASLRTVAKGKFITLARKAVTEYAKAHENEVPADISELGPLLNPGVNSEILLAYRLTRSAPSVRSRWEIEEIRSSVDPEYDSHAKFGPSSTSNTPVNPTSTAFNKAMSEYRRTNSGLKPANLTELRPFLPAEGLDEDHLNQLFGAAR